MSRYLIVAGAFFYVLVCGFFVQRVLLPRWMPNAHGGAGLLKGSDSAGFHAEAVARAEAIREGGWSEWTLRPGGQSVAGIASAVYVLTGRSSPLMFLPLNAALWAFSAWMLLKILQPLTSSGLRAVVCALPFLLAPSALVFLTQMHKDPMVIAGILVLWYALSSLVAERDSVRAWREAGRCMTWIVCGSLLVWIGRPYLVFVFLAGLAMVGGLMLGDAVLRRVFRPALWCVLIAMAVLFAVLGLTKDSQQYNNSTSRFAAIPANGIAFHSSDLGAVDSLFCRMALMRRAYLEGYPEAGSKLDEGVVLDSTWKVLGYVPRAIQLLLFVPFPTDWIGRTVSNPLFALVNVETAAWYLLVPGLAWLFWRKRACLAFWTPLLFVIPAQIIYAFIVPNIGSLVRARFSLVMLLASFGMLGTLDLWDAWRRRRRRTP